jgi:hypothetical protein
MVSDIQDLPHLERLRFYGLVTVLAFSLFLKPWNLFSYSNAPEIHPIEFFPL